jgi:hypothetical protein
MKDFLDFLPGMIVTIEGNTIRMENPESAPFLRGPTEAFDSY